MHAQVYHKCNGTTSLSDIMRELSCWVEHDLDHLEWFDVFDTTEHTKQTASSELYPHRTKTQNCTLMFLSNLADIEWIQIGCNDSILPHVTCNTKNVSIEVPYFPPRETCQVPFLLVDRTCISFVWLTAKTEEKRRIFSQKKSVNINTFGFLFKAVRPTFPPVVLEAQSRDFAESWTISKHLNTIDYKMELVLLSDTVGFFVTESSSEQHTLRNMFRCQKQSFASQFLHCDGKIDCSHDASDEMCCEGNQSNTLKNCREIELVDNRTCPVLFYTSLKGLCHKYIPQYHKNTLLSAQHHNVSFSCTDGPQLNSLFVDDLMSECGSNGEDEPILLLLSIGKQLAHCQLPFEMPCYPGHSKCHNVTDICFYRLNKFNHVVPCRNGGHLYNCVDFDCNAMFKCPKSFCVPWQYICNGKWDCSDGVDEVQSCTDNNMYICKHTVNNCIHTRSVRDHIQNCPHADDEDFCDLVHVDCPDQCHCLMYAMSCTQLQSFPHVFIGTPYMFLHVEGSHNMNSEKFGENFPHLVFVHLIADGICEVCVYVDLAVNSSCVECHSQQNQ